MYKINDTYLQKEWYADEKEVLSLGEYYAERINNESESNESEVTATTLDDAINVLESANIYVTTISNKYSV